MGHGRFRRTIDVAAECQLSICADAEMLKKRRGGGSGRLARGAGNGQEPRSFQLPDIGLGLSDREACLHDIIVPGTLVPLPAALGVPRRLLR